MKKLFKVRRSAWEKVTALFHNHSVCCDGAAVDDGSHRQEETTRAAGRETRRAGDGTVKFYGR